MPVCVCTHRGLWHCVAAGGEGCSRQNRRIFLHQSSSVQDAAERDKAISHLMFPARYSPKRGIGKRKI